MDDEIWRPDYQGPPPVAGPVSLDTESARPVDAPGSEARRSGRIVSVAFVVAALASIAAIVGFARSRNIETLGVYASAAPVADGRSSADVEPIVALGGLGRPVGAADDPQRLPETIPSLWTTELPQLRADGGGSAMTWTETIGDRFVVVGTGDARATSGPAAVHLLDAATGRRVWVTQVETRLDRVRFAAAIGESLVLTVDSEVVAFELGSGRRLWAAELTGADGRRQHVERLDGTDLLGLFRPGPVESVVVIDSATGSVVTEMTGVVLGTDAKGRWYVQRGEEVLEFDLGGSTVNAGSGRSVSASVDGELVATVAASGQPVAVIDDVLVTSVGGELASGPIRVGGERTVGGDGLTPLTLADSVPDGLVLVGGLVPLGGPGFLVVGGGMVHGAEVLDGSIRFAWSRRGSLTATLPNEESAQLIVASNGGSTQTLVDAATGDTVVVLTMTPGMLETLDVVANGVVVRRTSRDGQRIAGLDLAGNELWALDGPAPAAVGFGMVVRSLPQSDGSYEVTAYGALR